MHIGRRSAAAAVCLITTALLILTALPPPTPIARHPIAPTPPPPPLPAASPPLPPPPWTNTAPCMAGYTSPSPGAPCRCTASAALCAAMLLPHCVIADADAWHSATGHPPRSPHGFFAPCVLASLGAIGKPRPPAHFSPLPCACFDACAALHALSFDPPVAASVFASRDVSATWCVDIAAPLSAALTTPSALRIRTLAPDLSWSAPHLPSPHPLLPIAACAHLRYCSGRGWCVPPGACACLGPYGGPECAALDPDLAIACLNDCHASVGGGTCVAGVCVCADGRAGDDCGQSAARPALLPHPACALTVHVAALPPRFSLPWAIANRGRALDWVRPNVQLMYEDVLRFDACSVASPADADVIVVPFAGPRTYNRLAVLDALAAALPRLWPWGGPTFVWLPMVDDMGWGTYFHSHPQYAPDSDLAHTLNTSVFLVHSGLHAGHATPQIPIGDFRPRHDIVVPPFVGPSAFPPITDRELAALPFPRPLLFFAGTTADAHVWTVGAGNGRLALDLALGTRAHNPQPSVWDVGRARVDHFALRTRAARFNAAPLGYRGGWGIRSAYSLAAGVPLVVVDDHVSHALDELWDWSAFSLAFSPRDAELIAAALTALAPEDEAAMRRAAACVARAYDWTPSANRTNLWVHVLATLVVRARHQPPAHPCDVDALAIVLSGK